MTQVLLFAGAVIFLVHGVSHGVRTLRDLSLPRTFTPTDESVHHAMRKTKVAMSPAPTFGTPGSVSTSIDAAAGFAGYDVCGRCA